MLVNKEVKGSVTASFHHSKVFLIQNQNIMYCHLFGPAIKPGRQNSILSYI